ncbi:MAG: hypothetical protein ASARMPRED_001502 [Alectoria sarmentosa]|nr:MAG: hypothetical protein ASARMPRED_001502 [Alectoria sarmentosa]
MPLTMTLHKASFYRPLPQSSTFSFPSPASLDTPTISPTIINFHVGSEITTQYHWHTTHTEYLRVITGAALIMVSGVSKIYTAKDGAAQVPRYARHEWMRFDRPARLLNKGQREAQEAYFQEHGREEVEKLKGEDLIAEEWTDPADGQKEIFFRNIFSTLSEPQYQSNTSWLGELWKTLQLMCVMWELDNYVVLVDFGGWRGGWRNLVEAAFTYGVMGFLMTLGRIFGCKAVSEEYTPKHLIQTWESERPKSE